MIPCVSITFFLYHNKKNKKTNEVPIYYKLKLNTTNEEKAFSTGYFIKPDDWLKGSVKNKKGGNAQEVNNHLNNLKLKVQAVQNKIILSDKPFNLSDIINDLSGKNKKDEGLIQFFNFYLEKLFDSVGKTHSLGTYKRFKVIRNDLVSFLDVKFKKKECKLSSLDYGFIQDFKDYLSYEKENSHNVVSKKSKVFKQVVTEARKRKLLDFDPFEQIKNTFEKTKIIYLTESELIRLETKEFSNPRLDIIRDLFIFSCYTSLAFSEAKNLSNENIVEIEGRNWIVMTRQKTISKGEDLQIPLLSVAESLINKYKNHEKCLITGKLLPVPSNQKYNEYLKEIAAICGISKKLTTHIARKTFATTVALQNDVPLHIVGEILGHGDLKITKNHYAVVVKKTIGKAMDKLDQKLKREKIKRKKLALEPV